MALNCPPVVSMVASRTMGTPAGERSLLRSLLPLRVQGSGPYSVLLRHAFLQQEGLIQRVLGTLEKAPLPALPRLLCAEAFQRLLEGQAPQRELRELFEEAEMECRKLLLDLTSYEHLKQRERSSIDYAQRLAIQRDPLTRLLAYQLRAACGFFTRLMGISSTPNVEANAIMRTLIATDVRTDPLLRTVMLNFKDHPRNTATGERLAPVPDPVDAFVKECLLLERDVFGRFRFDPRGDNRHLLHCILLKDITKSPQSLAVVLDPTFRQYGHLCLTSSEVHKGRWMEYSLSCGEEMHLIDPALPRLETVTTTDEVTGGPLSLMVFYDEPICHIRHKLTTREDMANADHTEVFQLAMENRNRSYWERYFLDR